VFVAISVEVVSVEYTEYTLASVVTSSMNFFRIGRWTWERWMLQRTRLTFEIFIATAALVAVAFLSFLHAAVSQKKNDRMVLMLE